MAKGLIMKIRNGIEFPVISLKGQGTAKHACPLGEITTRKLKVYMGSEKVKYFHILKNFLLKL